MSKKEILKKNIMVEVVVVLMIAMIIIGCPNSKGKSEVRDVVATEIVPDNNEVTETKTEEDVQANIELEKKEKMKKIKESVVLVNKQNKLSSDFVPENLVVANVRSDGEVRLEQETSKMLEKLFAKASEQGVNLFLVSGYRPYKYQSKIYENSLKVCGAEYTNQYVAKPGASEHQTGLAADISSVNNRELTEQFENTKEGQWLIKNAYDFGFILRYLKGKESITGYGYEPWHIRYVGKEVAKEIQNSGLTLEEYLQID